MSIVERKHHQKIEMGNFFMKDARLRGEFWLEAFIVVVYVINKLPSRNTSNKSPYEIIHKQVPNYSLLKVYDYICYPLLLAKNRSKIESKSTEYIFIGYDREHKAYRCLDQSSTRVIISNR